MSRTAWVRRSEPQWREARSYAKPREVLMQFGRPDAYYEWGGPSAFVEPQEPNDDHGDNPPRKRYSFSEEARSFKLSLIEDISTPNLQLVNGITEAPVTSFAMGGPDNIQHRFYMDQAKPAGGVVYSGFSPIIPIPNGYPSFSNPYDFVPFEGD